MEEKTQELEKNLKLAYSYLEDSSILLDNVNDLRELEEQEEQVLDTLINVDKANKKIKEIEKQDPDFITTIKNSEGESIDISVNILKAFSLYLEGTYKLGLKERKKSIKLLNQSLSLMSNSDINPELKLDVYDKLSIAYRWMGEKSKCIEMLEKAKEINTDESREIEIEKELDEQKNNSVIWFKLFAFQGSWIVLLVLAVLTLGSFATLSSQPAGGILSILFFGSLTWLYWWWNTRY